MAEHTETTDIVGSFDGVLSHLNERLVTLETERLLLQSTIYAVVKERAAIVRAPVVTTESSDG